MKKLFSVFLGLVFLAFAPSVFGATQAGDNVLIPGDTAITVLGTIATGTWEGTVVDVTRGGTGLADPTDHTILIGSGATALTPMAVGGAGVLLMGVAASDPVWAVTALVEGANDFSLTKGTAILDVDAPLQITGTGAVITGVDQANTFSMAENLTVSGGAAVILASVDQENTFTMNESFTVGDGNSGIVVFSAASKTITVEDDAIVSQDMTADASPEFADLLLSGGDLTLGVSDTAYAGKIVMHDADAADGNTVSIQANADLGASYVLTLPPDDGNDGEFIKTDGSGNLSFAVPDATPAWGSIEEKTIATGVITTGGDLFLAITEEGDAADAVTSIDGAAVGDVLVLKGVVALNNIITFTDDDDDLDLQADFLMDNQNDTLVLICIATGTPDTFIELSRASNG